MRTNSTFVLTAACAVSAAMAVGLSTASAQPITSGVAEGRTMISMQIEKRAGYEDGVRIGEDICYT